jgi:hypothetical protein
MDPVLLTREEALELLYAAMENLRWWTDDALAAVVTAVAVADAGAAVYAVVTPEEKAAAECVG